MDEATIKSKTIWCADGDVCTLPPGKTSLLIGGWTITEDGNRDLVFKRGDASDAADQPYLKMGVDGNFWVSRSTSRGWVADTIGGLNQKLKNFNTDWVFTKDGSDLRIHPPNEHWNYYQFKRDVGHNDKWADWTKR